MGGVDRFLISYYHIINKIIDLIRKYFRITMNLLEMILINSYILYRES